MDKILIPSQSPRPKGGSGRDLEVRRLRPNPLLRWLQQLLVKVEQQAPEGSSPPDWPEDEADQMGEDDNHYYYYFYCPEIAKIDVDINLHKGLVLVRVAK